MRWLIAASILAHVGCCIGEGPEVGSDSATKPTCVEHSCAGLTACCFPDEIQCSDGNCYAAFSECRAAGGLQCITDGTDAGVTPSPSCRSDPSCDGVADGTACNDPLWCHVNAACFDGSCCADLRDCSDADPATVDACSNSLGVCQHW